MEAIGEISQSGRPSCALLIASAWPRRPGPEHKSLVSLDMGRSSDLPNSHDLKRLGVRRAPDRRALDWSPPTSPLSWGRPPVACLAQRSAESRRFCLDTCCSWARCRSTQPAPWDTLGSQRPSAPRHPAAGTSHFRSNSPIGAWRTQFFIDSNSCLATWAASALHGQWRTSREPARSARARSSAYQAPPEF